MNSNLDHDEPKLSSLIEDQELREIAETHGLDDWEWGTKNPVRSVMMMEGAAIAISEIYKVEGQGRTADVYIHQSGAIEIWNGAYFQYVLNPKDEVEIDHGLDWDDDPVVKQFKHEPLTLAWAENGYKEGGDD